MIQRTVFEDLKKEFSKKRITALVGARQVGKTTLMKQLFEIVKDESIYLKFDNIEVLNLFDLNIEAFITQYIRPYTYIFIDEIQYSKKSGKYLKYIIDEFEDKKVFVTGSSTPELSISTLSYLVGRVRIFEVYGISFEEFINFKDSTKLPLLKDGSSDSGAMIQFRNLLIEYLMYGSYPAVIVEDDVEEKKIILKDIINTYLLKEIREILQYENAYQFELLSKRLSLSDGGILNYSSISGDVSINSLKVKEMISILEKTYILNLVRPYFNNKIKELIKSAKVYFLDTGFKNSLTNNFAEFDFRADKGELYESFILKAMLLEGLTPTFWNFKNEYEVDFVLEKDSKRYGFEVKSRLNSSSITTSMKKFIDSSSPTVLYILNENIDAVKKYNGVEIVFTSHLNIFSILRGI